MNKNQFKGSMMSAPPSKKNKSAVEEALEKQMGFGGELAARMTTHLPGSGSKFSPFGYTSKKEIREKILEIIKLPPPTLTAKQLAATGIDLDPVLSARFRNSKKVKVTYEDKLKVAETWIAKNIAEAEKRGRLMTDQQLMDWRIGRKLGEGDRARYIGKDREEVTQANLIVPRPHGQTGFITSVVEEKESFIITFQPDEAVEPCQAPGVEKQFVALQVREHTPGWLTLERIPDVG